MMYFYKHIDFRYYETEEFQCLELPYKGRKYSMYVVLPRQKYGLERVFITINLLDVLNSVTISEEKLVRVQFPKFKFESSFDLKNVLTNMGNAFDKEKVDFSGINQHQLFISKMIHKATISVSLTILLEYV